MALGPHVPHSSTYIPEFLVFASCFWVGAGLVFFF